ncbi:MAG TPA: polysaccharide deacetylase family protein [Solirubrobacteraceae bacterium]|jgi:peptidoglycan/xylan/chitin deacetylase (PgdA/CDA1 family)|nr:polysaccharide deacetylase family protein [Solirubrobacteraceae bacterium]
MDIDQRRARREARRREVTRRRKRGLAAVALLGALVALVVLLLSAGSSSKSGSRNASSGTSDSGAGAGSKHAKDGSAASTLGAATGTGGGSTTTAGGQRDTGAGTAGTGRGTPGTEAVPILMYHVINPPPAGAKFPGLYVAPEEFAAQMQALSQAGFHAVTMDQMWANWTRGTPLPKGKPVVVSFDNGYQSQLTQALPVLQRLRWVGVENIQLTGLPPSQGGLSEAQVAQLVADGWELDTQGISHADLITLSPGALHEQVTVAREEVQRRYHVPVNWFCYPSGHYNATVIAEVKAAGYVGSTTVVPGWATPTEDLYRLPRLRVLGGTSPQALLAELAAIRPDPPPPASYGGA